METLLDINKDIKKEGLFMGEIKTDMFPEVLRMRAKEKQDREKRNRQEIIQSNAVVPAEEISESLKKGKKDQAL